jgi:hypothetical protein
MYFLYKNEYRIKPVEFTITRRLRWKGEKNGGDEPVQDKIHIYMEL